MKTAFIDIGTNTILLLLVDWAKDRSYRILVDSCHIVRLGQGLTQHDSFLPEAQARALAALQDFKAICDAHSCHNILAVGTAAFRKAKNGANFAQTLTNTLGFQINILSGQDEAILISKATRADFSDLPFPLLTIDIGGGSTEFIVDFQDGGREAFSLPFGVVRLTEEFLAKDPPDLPSVLCLREFVRDQVLSLLPRFSHRPASMVATAGTPTTLSAIAQNLPQYDSAKVHKSVLQRSQVDAIFNKLSRMTLEEREKLACLPTKRADVILAGCLILSEIMKGFSFEKTAVSDRGLRYGLLQEFLQNQDVLKF